MPVSMEETQRFYKYMEDKLNGALPAFLRIVYEATCQDPWIVDGSKAGLVDHDHVKQSAMFVQDMFRYNMADGKKLRALLFLSMYDAMRDHQTSRNLDELSTEHILKNDAVMALAWSIEALQSSFLVSDDLMDQSEIRRGKPSWYMEVAKQRCGISKPGDPQKSVVDGIAAINDSFSLLAVEWYVIDKYFDGDQHKRLARLFHETFLHTVTGQRMDMDTTAQKSIGSILEQVGRSLNDLSIDFLAVMKGLRNRHSAIINYKTTLYTLRLPVQVAVILASGNSTTMMTVHLGQLNEICELIGQMFQVRDDMLDWDKGMSKSGKSMYTDIAEGKLTWPLMVTLENLQKTKNKDGMKTLEKNYGRSDTEACKLVADMYEKLKVKDEYCSYIAGISQRLDSLVSEIKEPSVQRAIQHAINIFCPS